MSTAESTAARARARAEARRARILAQSEDRINVVSGITPRSTVKEATTIEKVESKQQEQYDEFLSIIGDDNNNNANDNGVADDVDVDVVATISNVSDPPPTVQIVGDADEARGARRMAAMRRRRVKGGGGGSSKPVMAEDEKITTDETNTALGENIAAVKIGEEPMLVVEAEESSPTVVTTTNRVSKSVTLEATAKDMDIDDEDVEQKKYMGVARMRRKRLKEEKEKRLQEIANDGDSPRSTVDLIATLGVTATTMRKGVATVVDVNGIVGVVNGSSSSKKTKKSWITYLIPPMKLMPRLVTLLLLFIAGFDLGTQPHRPTPSSLTSLYPQHTIDDLRVLFGGGGHLIHRIETSLTKPWEYGMGGRVAYMTGQTASAPPTAMPTYFDNKVAEIEEECIINGVVGECMPSPITDDIDGGSAIKDKKNRLQTLLDKKRNNNNNNRKDKVKERLHELVKEDDNSIVVGGVVNDDEFDNSDRTTKPMGVLNDDNNITIGIIDPIFRVDLDSLLYNANLPMPIEYAAKIAITFHRVWVYYLWTMPTTILKSMVGMPRRALSGWIANPPYLLGVALFIRFVTHVVVGNGKSPFSLDSSKDDAGGGNNSSSGGGGSSPGNNLDILTKGMDFVKNYASSKFPMTTLVMGTLSKVMKVDMYVLLCGLLIGLAITPTEDDHYHIDDGGSVENVVRRSVLGDGEL
jgi:hypothetical protein